MTINRPQSESLWSVQLGALGIDAGAETSKASRAEAARMARLRLPPLDLPAAERSTVFVPKGRWPAIVATLAVAAAVTFVLARPREENILHVKGGSQTRIYWDRDGNVKLFDAASVLRDGDRVRAEIDAQGDGTAYWLITDRDGKALVDADFVAASAVPMTSGEAVAFAQGLKLTGASVGETLTILMCTGAPLTHSAVAQAVPQVGEQVTLETLGSACATRVVRLRP